MSFTTFGSLVEVDRSSAVVGSGTVVVMSRSVVGVATDVVGLGSDVDIPLSPVVVRIEAVEGIIVVVLSCASVVAVDVLLARV